jgi:chromate reductase, NAD(P)H dehydrogenase (quinone)
MSDRPRILALAGSTRADSYNKRLVGIAARAAESGGAETTVIDLRDFALPLFDEDLERAEGPPAGATKLKQLMIASDGFLISSPEYNSSISGVLKNAIDWASREAPGERALAAFQGKVATLLSASPGALGGLRGLVHLRSILGNIGVIVLPDQVALPRAFEIYGEEGALKDPKQQAKIEGLGRNLAQFLVQMKK